MADYMAQNNIDLEGFGSTAATSTAGSSFGGWGSLFSVAGGVLSVTAAYGQAKVQQAALQAQAQVAQNNEIMAGWQADMAIERGEDAANMARMKGAQVKSSQRAALAANGVDLSVGSAQAVQNDTDYITAVDATTLKNNAALEAWGYRKQARQYAGQAVSAAGGASAVSPWLAAGTSVLTSATNVASRWYQSSIRGA